MLSELDITESINFVYNDVAPVTPFVLNFPTSEPYEFLAFRSTITSAGAIVLPGINVLDENSNSIITMSIIPWQFAATTITTTTGQTPDVSVAALFGPNIGSFIPSGFHVFSGWQIIWVDFLGTPGVIFNGTFTFGIANFHD